MTTNVVPDAQCIVKDGVGAIVLWNYSSNGGGFQRFNVTVRVSRVKVRVRVRLVLGLGLGLVLVVGW